MAFNFPDPRKLLQTTNTPGSFLSPKPGVQEAGGNQPAPVLSQPEQTAQPSITPKAEYKPIADPVNKTNDPLSYQEALTQGRLNAGAGTLANNDPNSAGGYGGYNPNNPPKGYDANAWAINAPGGIDPSKGWYVDDRTGQQVAGVKYYPDETGGAQFTPLQGLTKEAFNALPPTQRQAMMSQFTPQQMYEYGIWQRPAEDQPLPDWLRPDFKGDALAASGLGGDLTTGPIVKGAVAEGIGRFAPGSVDINKDTRQSTQAETMITPKGQGARLADLNIGPGSAIKNPAPTPPSVTQPADKTAGDDSLSKIFKYFKGELERNRDVQLSEADADAARRGVFYGTPGSQSREDVRDRFGRSLSELEANLLQNESQNELSRLGLATNLFGMLQQGDISRLGLAAGLIPNDMEAPSVDPNMYAEISKMFGGRNKTAPTAATVPAAVPSISPPKPSNVKSVNTAAQKTLKKPNI